MMLLKTFPHVATSWHLVWIENDNIAQCRLQIKMYNNKTNNKNYDNRAKKRTNNGLIMIIISLNVLLLIIIITIIY